jgi:UDP-glucose 4-epimerase
MKTHMPSAAGWRQPDCEMDNKQRGGGKMAVFVTGGAGYIGSHTVLELLKRGCDIVVADNFSNSKPEAVARVKRLSRRDFPFYNIDVRDADRLDEIFTDHNIDCIIHFAGLKAVGESVKLPLAYYANNLDSTIALCNAMVKHGVGKLVFSSSATVYSGGNAMPLTEESAVGNCSNPYGWTKYMCEQILRDAANANGGWSVALLRYFNPIGAHESGDIGEDSQDVPNNLMPYIAQTAVGRREFLSVFGSDYDTPDGTCIRDYIHVADLAVGHAAAIEYLEKNVGTAVFNLGTGKGTSVLEMVSAFERASGVTVPRKIVGRRDGDLPIYYAATEKAKRELSWSAGKTISDACEDTWRWQSKNPNGFKV